MTRAKEDDATTLVAVLPALLRAAGVSSVEVEVISRPASFRGGDVGPEAQTITRAARARSREAGFGFWEFVLQDMSQVSQQTREALIAGALRHDTAGSKELHIMSVDELEDALADRRWADMAARTVVSLCSRLPQNPGALHVPMLDLAIRDAGALTAQVAGDALSALGVNGILLASGNSYHFVGERLLDDVDLVQFLAHAQLLSPIVDARWVSHALIDGECRLRISTDVERHTRETRLVARIGRRG